MATQLKATPIQARTKGEVKRLRKQGFVPISVQHQGEETMHLQGEAKPLNEFIRMHGEATFLDLILEGKSKPARVLVHDVQRDPVSHGLLQVTFQRVRRGDKIKVHVPVILHGEPEAVKFGTAVLQRPLEQVEIQCGPDNMPDHITLDIAKMEYGHSLRVSDLLTTGRYEVLTPAEQVLVTLSSLTAHADEEAKAPVEPEASAPATEMETPA